MARVSLIIAFALLCSFAEPLPVRAAPTTSRSDILQACLVLHRWDESVSSVQCLGFLDTIDMSPQGNWVPPFCRALDYFEPELFYSLYNSVADCIARNK